MQDNIFKSIYSLGQVVRLKGTALNVRIVEITFSLYSMPYLTCCAYNEDNVKMWYDVYEDEVAEI